MYNMSKIFAKVGDAEITQETLDELIQSIPPQYAQQLQQGGNEGLIEEAINQELFLLDAKANNLQESPVYQAEMKRLQKQLLRGVAINAVLEKVDVSDEELQAYYDEHAHEFITEEEISASHILVDEEAEAKAILERIEAGEDFAELASELSKCPSSGNGGSLGHFGRGRMVGEFEEAAFELGVGEVSQPVQTQFGYHLIKVDERNDARKMEFAEVRDQIYQSLRNAKQQEAYTNYLEELKKQYPVVRE